MHSADINFSVVHINHNINNQSGKWARFCQSMCKELNIPIIIQNTTINNEKKIGIEAAARQQRYLSFGQLGCDVIVLAHHLNDNVENFFIRLLRGSGIDGLSSMDEETKINKILYLRPLINVDKEFIVNYAHNNQLKWIDDPSNNDETIVRNKIRKSVFPILQTINCGFISNINRTIAHIKNTKKYINTSIQEEYKETFYTKTIKTQSFEKLNNYEQKYLFKIFFSNEFNYIPSEKFINEFINTFKKSNKFLIKGFSFYVDENIIKIFQHKKIPDEIISLHSKNIIKSRNFIVKEINQLGLSFSAIKNLKLVFSVRKGGEFFNYKNKTISLKNFLYDKKIPKWQSDFLVLIYLNNEIIYIEDHFIDKNYLANNYDDSINFTIHY